MTQQMLKTHWVTASLLPLTVTARSVELGNISEATFNIRWKIKTFFTEKKAPLFSHSTWIEAPVISLISLIFDPPFPISDPHCEAGTMSLKVIGGRGTVAGDTRVAKSWKNVSIFQSVSLLDHPKSCGEKRKRESKQSSEGDLFRKLAFLLGQEASVSLWARSNQLVSSHRLTAATMWNLSLEGFLPCLLAFFLEEMFRFLKNRLDPSIGKRLHGT